MSRGLGDVYKRQVSLFIIFITRSSQSIKIQSEVSCPSTPKTKKLLLFRFSITLSDSAFACLDEVADAIIISSANEEIFFKSMHVMSLAFNSSREFMQRFFNEVFAKLFCF